MKPLRHRSIKTKLTLLMMLISVLLLLVVSGVVLTAEYFQSRAELVQQLRVLSNTLTSTTRQPLLLGKHADAQRLLESLTTQQHIQAAYLFDGQGQPVAQYLVQNNAPLVWQGLSSDFNEAANEFRQLSDVEQLRKGSNSFGLFSPIFFDDRHIGTLYLLSDAQSVQERLGVVLFAVVMSLLLLFCCSWLLAGWLQKPVSEPLVSLTRIMTRISEERRYSLRARKSGNDEIGTLVDIFNRMLEQIEEHQQQQRQYQQQLEETVERRTADLRETMAELEVARAQADEANAAKSLFLSRITHELRTPMIGVLGMNGLLSRTGLTPQQKMLVDTIRKSGEDLLTMVSDVLDMSRIEAGKMPLVIETVDIADIIEDVTRLLISQAQDKGLVLRNEISSEELWLVEADRAKINQILLNLVGNAIKFTRSGSVIIRLHMTAQPEDLTALCRIEVEDSGVGMSEDESRKVFDLFHQLDNQSAQARSGSGLGLAIVKQFVDLMNGSIALSSRTGHGTRFELIFKFPKSESPAPTRDHSRLKQHKTNPDTIDTIIVDDSCLITASEKSDMPKQVLFVGRHPALKQLLSLALAQYQYQLICADDLSSAAVAAAHSSYLLVFIDVAAVTRKQLEQSLLSGRLPKKSYLLIDDQTADLSDRIQACCAGFIRKPVRAEVLTSILATETQNEQAGLLSVGAGEAES